MQDTTAPVVTASLVSDTGSSPSDSITSDATLTGSGDPNAVVTLYEGSTTLGTATADPSGNWTFTPTGLADGLHTIVASETDAAGNTGTASLNFTLDQDSAEQAALSLNLTNTNIGMAGASAVPFNITGLDPEDTGTVTFTDANNNTVQISVSGTQSSYTANLNSLADGQITSSLQVNTDRAGNIFTPVAGTTVTLDQDKGQAQFILQDSSFGANTLTVDTSTGLAWLNVSLTAGHSYNDISSQLGAGQLYQGYRFATVAEVQTLWADFGVSLTPAASISQLEADLGIGDVWFDGTREVYGLTADSLSPGTHEAVYWAFNNPNFGAGVGVLAGQGQGAPDTAGYLPYGAPYTSLLVKNVPTGEQAALSLLLSTPPSSRHTPTPFISPSAASMPRTARLSPLRIPRRHHQQDSKRQRHRHR